MPDPILAQTDLAVLIIIDMQARMMPAIDRGPTITASARKMLKAAGILGLPVLHTEQNPRGIGATTPEIAQSLPPESTPIIKSTCSCWSDPQFRARLQATNREHVILVGVETHVCIQQTALELLRVDYVPFIPADAVGSRRPFDRDTALARMARAGAIITSTESLIFELVRRCDVPEFKPLLELVKQTNDEPG